MIMKKIFTLMLLSVMTVAANAAITIHVKADVAPYLWAWVGSTNLMTEAWPGHQLTEKKTVQGTEFWYYTFDESVTQVSILFNDGGASGPVQQTRDFNGIKEDRYFEYDGANTAVDVTEQYGGEIPDAEVTALGLAGNHNSWGSDPFDVVVPGKTFRINVDLTDVAVEDDLWRFKIRPNNAEWVGFLGVTFDGAVPEWIYEAMADGNFEVDLELAGRIFTLTATWGGGQNADENWTFKAEAGSSTGITPLVTTSDVNAPRYDLSGRRVSESYHGVIIQNGKKVVIK
jgi:hypothetical protein